MFSVFPCLFVQYWSLYLFFISMSFLYLYNGNFFIFIIHMKTESSIVKFKTACKDFNFDF